MTSSISQDGKTYIPLIILITIITLGLSLKKPMNNLVIKMSTNLSVYQLDSIQIVLTRKKLESDIRTNESRIAKKSPSGPYIVINSSANEFSLYNGSKLLRKDKCSTGSYIMLKTQGDEEYLFKTPKGEFRIQGKIESPVWRKPDWAFVEEGLPVPSATHHSRYEAGVLGDYALSLGQGYLIHGTLYQRYLGLPVTHGCIRLNDDNLELVYKTLKIGSKVYIF